MNLRGRLRLLPLLLLLFAACSSAPAYTIDRQTVDGLTIALERPTRPSAETSYDFFVTLTDAEGRPVDDASIFLELDMPGMPMGTNQPLATPLGDGRYRLAAAYSMDGAWFVRVNVTVEGREYIATFDQIVTP
jgi:nitrogen fixation protein FixH